ncbi:helicase C-terminal domain-containing protein [Agathobacter rectalis]|uniref:helicase C-terminal domain-containing protein n=1 Tax=Agathobacter rectalis TaxID=39491 RepID=UPI00131409AF|nr:helicase C-terminal domain-containing protein [Agathobacter rectalis]
MNEEKGPAIYVVPDNYLVKQVIDEAKRLGISATVDKDDYNYSNSKAILVTSIQTIVNGHSYFGMREAGNYPIGSIIIDDVHACMDKIIDQFMIKIDAETDAYKELIALFSSSLKDYNPKNYIDVVEMKDCRNNMLVPYWEWQRQQDNIYRILTKYNNSDNTSIYFGLPLIERCLETCDCIITASAIEISPKGIDLDKISSLEEASRRIYMSATLADDSVFVSALGLDTEDMKNIITPENANDMGDRLIIFPKYVNSDISEIEIKEKVEETAKKYNVVILVPSFSRAKFWDEQGMRTVTKDNIDGIVKALKSGKHVGKIIFVNRYDGIDLPGDACRMLVIDGLPPLNSIKDRYIQSVAPQSTILLREQVQRIEQGMGRGVRSNDDECCVVLMGDELSDVLSRNKGIDYFSAATRCQYDLSKQLWDLLVSETGSKPTIDQIFELANYSLEKNAEWVTTCKENLAAVKYSTEAKVDEKIVAQRKAFEKAINMQWLDAANAIKIVKDKENDKKTKGYLCQIQAEYINKIDSALSQEILKVGKNLSAAILSPLAGIQYQRTINTIPQAQAISTNLLAGKLGLNELLVYIDGVLSNLCIGSEYEKFEEALNQIGVVLGFVCSRPDKETGGYGPDNLWAIDSNKYLVIECKTEAITQTIKKDYCNQLSGSVNWFKENYVYPNECTPIIVHPSKFVDVVASPDENMRVMTEEELTCFRKNIRDFYSALCHNGSISDISKINELLSIYKLRKDDIVNRYTVKFERQK